MRKKIVITILLLAVTVAAVLTLRQGQTPTRIADSRPAPAHQHAPAEPGAKPAAYRLQKQGLSAAQRRGRIISEYANK
jgi:hypothetical protein